MALNWFYYIRQSLFPQPLPPLATIVLQWIPLLTTENCWWHQHNNNVTLFLHKQRICIIQWEPLPLAFMGRVYLIFPDTIPTITFALTQHGDAWTYQATDNSPLSPQDAYNQRIRQFPGSILP